MYCCLKEAQTPEGSITLTHTDSCKTESCVCIYPRAIVPVLQSRLSARYVKVTEADRAASAADL